MRILTFGVYVVLQHVFKLSEAAAGIQTFF